ncbi:MAG: UDP-N-acetylmuramoyl-L-alanyl-D-glutamate--2,6-diaminopimelate ligase [Clostridiales bacterium]|jgi:UDP-N-acetylmuramoyl-L-alanyl-D-glutamate--2,6-diaminopimelate ligase|nr:UDP-N-acetylmuramoyl-L-alanyl-D-glutamate--2,6-diaminopimelate ligase [Clostridiales bacterium]
MLLSALLDTVPLTARYGGDVNVKSLSASADGCGVCALFFCLAGTRHDGHDYAEIARKNGAVALVTQRRLPVDMPQVVVPDTREAMARIAGNFYGNPARGMKMVGITGTNGKTTTTFIARSIAEAAGYRVGLIGTTAVYIGGERLPAHLTTPDPIELHALLAKMADAGCDWVIMEVSAHAIALKKLAGIVFDVLMFSNLSGDHLDFFGTMERYRSTKVDYFCSQNARLAVVNVDDEAGREILMNADLPCYTYGTELPADVFAVDYNAAVDGQSYVINLLDHLYDIRFSLPGRFNLYNSMAAATAAFLLGVDLKTIAAGIASLTAVPGRYNILNTEPFRVIVDYAHTPDGLKNVLSSIREYAAARVLVVFGCGGDRDKTKRAAMGEVAGSLSDYAVITSDNPRGEEPEAIIAAVEIGMKRTGTPYACIVDRAKAIAHALSYAAKDDVILIAGKGDEPYQEIMGVKYPFSDEAVVYGLRKEQLN